MNNEVIRVEDLKQGFIFYSASIDSFKKYEYLSPMPTANGSKYKMSYHIIIDKLTEKPIRMYRDDLERILNGNLRTLEDVFKKQLEYAENLVVSLKKKLNIQDE